MIFDITWIPKFRINWTDLKAKCNVYPFLILINPKMFFFNIMNIIENKCRLIVWGRW